MAQVTTSGIPFGLPVLGDGTGTTVTSATVGGEQKYELRSLGSLYFNVPSGLTVTLQRTFQSPDNPNAVWTTVTTGLTNQDYSYSGPPVSGFKFVRTAGTGTIYGNVSEGISATGGSSTSPAFVQGPAADNAPASGNPVLVGGEYNATPETYADGDAARLQVDANGYLKVREQYQAGSEDNTNLVSAGVERLLAGVSTYAPTLFTNYGANLTLNVKAAAGNVYSIHAQNINAALRYIQIHNTATTPAGGAVPLVSFPIPVTGSVFIDHTMLPAGGIYCATGIAFAISTTLATYTASATANEHNVFITYK